MDVNTFINILFLTIGIEGSFIVFFILFLTTRKFSTGVLKRSLLSFSFALLFLSISLVIQFVNILLGIKLDLALQIILLIFQILSFSFLTYASICFFFLSKEIGFGEIKKSQKLKRILKN